MQHRCRLREELAIEMIKKIREDRFKIRRE